MKTASPLYLNACRMTGVFLLFSSLTSCELPPRDAWNIIQRDGLLTYWSREYNPRIAPSRYLTSSGRPFVLSQAPQVPYRPRTLESRYLAANPDTTYRPRPNRVSRPRPSAAESVQSAPPKIHLEPSKTIPPSSPPTKVTEKPSMDSLPYGAPVPGRPGMVNSPFAEKQQLVDVTGMAPGEAVKDPYTGKLFRVPPTQQAASDKTEPLPTQAPDEPKPQP